jgi:glycosyltransferase involved in cell wall biosynthesis
MRIVYVLTSLGMGGAERQVLALAGRMAARGHTVALIVLRPRLLDGLSTSLEVVHLDMRKTPISSIRGFAHAVAFLRSFRPNLLHSHNVHGNLLAHLLRILHPAAPVVSTIHNVHEGGWPRMMAYRLTDPLCILSTAVCASAASRYVRLKAVPQRKCIVLANGIDTAEFAPSLDRRAATREQMRAGKSFIWLTAGRIVPAKDYPNLLRAFAQTRAAVTHAQLWIAGHAAESDAASVRALAAQLGGYEAIRWLDRRRDMAALFDAADAFVLGSAWEGMPLALGEAMAMEKPAVATDVGGVRELMGTTGNLVPANDAPALAKAMLAVMQTPAAIRQAQGHVARQRIAANFSMEAKADEWESLYGSTFRDSMVRPLTR